MHLTIDAGNTNISFALFHNMRLCHAWRTATDTRKTADDYAVWLLQLLALANLSPVDVHHVTLGSVVPDCDYSLRQLAKRYFTQAQFRQIHRASLPIPVTLPNPEEVGIDRLLNALAAIHHYGSPCIVLDFGTATTFDVINESGAYIGGVITPGPQLSAHALAQAAAKLPHVSMHRPQQVIGISTVTALQSGLYWGYIGMIEGMLQRICKEAFHGIMPKVITTGGLGVLFQQAIPAIQCHDAELTLKGLLLATNTP